MKAKEVQMHISFISEQATARLRNGRDDSLARF